MEELKQWCMEQFEKLLTKDFFFGFLKIAIPVIVLFVGSCVAYALVNNSNMSAAQTTIAEHAKQIEKLNIDINRKLDLLLQRSSK
jgi:hypothetical protein